MSNIDLIIFDCDGVLVDSEIIASKVEAEAYTEIGYEIDWQTMAERFAGATSLDIMKTIGEELERPLQLSFLDEIQIRIDERLEAQLEVIPDADTILDKLNAPRCICSNSGGERLTKSLKKFDLYEKFHPYVFSAREVGDKEPKPHPSVFLHAASEFGANPKNCIVIEDSTHGIEGAVAAGMRVIGFTGASHTYPGHAEALMDAGAETTIHRLSEVPTMVSAMSEWGGIA